MRTRGLQNPYFNLGWTDWTLTRTNGDDGISTVDSIKYGLMSGRPNLVGFPRVGQNYMLIARRVDASADITNVMTLSTVASYAFSEGDIVTYDIGYQVTAVTAGSRYLTARADVDGATNLNVELPLTVGVHYYPIAWRVDTDVTDQLEIAVRMLRSITGSYVADWVSIDNIRVHPALDYLTPADANDDDEVS